MTVLRAATVDFNEAANALVARIVSDRVERMVANPAHARSELARLQLGYLPWSTVAARAGAMLDQELERKHRGALEFGRVRDLTVACAYARRMEKEDA